MSRTRSRSRKHGKIRSMNKSTSTNTGTSMCEAGVGTWLLTYSVVWAGAGVLWYQQFLFPLHSAYYPASQPKLFLDKPRWGAVWTRLPIQPIAFWAFEQQIQVEEWNQWIGSTCWPLVLTTWRKRSFIQRSRSSRKSRISRRSRIGKCSISSSKLW